MKKYILSAFVLCFATACEKNLIEEELLDTKQESEVILQERDPNLPTAWARSQKNILKTASAQPSSNWPINAYIGRSYTIGNSIIGDPANIRGPILDYDKIQDIVTADPIRRTTIDIFSYSDYNRFEEKTSITKKISTGFSLNLGLFSLGRKKFTEEKFNTHQFNQNKNVLGQVDVEVREDLYQISLTPSNLRRIASTAMNEWYLDALYNSTIVDILNAYGPFVITGYYSGGRATAMYFGESEEEMDSSTRETNMETDINASFAWGTSKGDTENSVKLDYGFGRKNGNYVVEESELVENRISIETVGGGKDFQVRTPSQKVDEMSIDMSSWLNSLNDPSTHVFAGLTDNGLIAISDFMLEENFRRRFQDTHLGYLNTDQLLEPFIEIVKVLIRTTPAGEKLYDIAAVLNTRQGDKIVLGDGTAATATDAELRSNNNNSVFASKSQAIANEKKIYYKCLIKSDANKTILPLIRVPLSVNLKNVQEDRMYKFYNEESDMWYIYDTVGLSAYSFYLDDYILEVYGMKQWVDSLQEKPISMTNLYQRYTIIGL